MRRFKKRPLGGLALSLAFALGCGQEQGAKQEEGAAGGTIAADVGKPSIIPYRNGSDPAVRIVRDERGNRVLMMYTSSDVGTTTERSALFPMEKTFGYYLGDGGDPGDRNAWVDLARGSGPVADESLIFDTVSLPGGSYAPHSQHQWAPDAIKWPFPLNPFWYGPDENYILFVPNTWTSDALTSHIAVLSSNSPYSGFRMQDWNYAHILNSRHYESDPGILFDGTDVWMVYVDGDGSNCGGFQIVKLNHSDPLFVQAGPYKVVLTDAQHNRWPTDLLPRDTRRCPADTYEQTEYVEGASLYDMRYSDEGLPTGVNTSIYGPYYLVFPRSEGGNQIISYAIGGLTPNENDEILFKFMGDILPASTTSFTTHGSMALWNNQWVYFYHDEPDWDLGDGQAGNGRGSHNRRVHMECMWFNSDGTIAKLTRTSMTQTCAKPPLDAVTVQFQGSDAAAYAEYYYNNVKITCRRSDGGSCTQNFGQQNRPLVGHDLQLVGYCPGGQFGRWDGCSATIGPTGNQCLVALGETQRTLTMTCK